jgi:hypothetical protein
VRWESIERLVGSGRTYQPNPAHAPIYERGYGAFRCLYDVLQPYFHRHTHLI